MDKLWLHHIIKDTLLKEDYRYQYDKGYNPPFNVRNAAKHALMAVQQSKKVQPDASNEGSGLQKAKDLSNGIVLNHGQIKRMKAFFDNNYQTYKDEIALGKNINNSEIVQKWNLWGGDAGRTWVEQMINTSHDNNARSKSIRRNYGAGLTKNLMNPNNTRSTVKEAFINDKNELDDFEFDSNDNVNSTEYSPIEFGEEFRWGIFRICDDIEHFLIEISKDFSAQLKNDYLNDVEEWKKNQFFEYIRPSNIKNFIHADYSSSTSLLSFLYLKKSFVEEIDNFLS